MPFQVGQDESIPEVFVEQVRDVLAHLWDFPYLQQHALAQAEDTNQEASGQRLRQQVMAAIASHMPEEDVGVPTPQVRPFHVLTLHYVEGLTVQQAAHKLSISPRQAHRDLRRGEENVAVVLWSRRSSTETRAIEISSIQKEIGRLETQVGSTDLRLLMERAQGAVQRLASQRGIRFQVEAPAQPVVVSCDQTQALQVLVSTLSHIVQQGQDQTISLVLRTDHENTSVTMRYRPELQPRATAPQHDVTTQLAHRLHWTVEHSVGLDNVHAIVLKIIAAGPTVVVIDDNEGLVALLERYLTHHTCRVVAATQGREGLRLAQDLLPDAILLDVMMPQMDGWEILQTLRNHPRTAQIPVVVCTVFNDPGLAYSLGASFFLPKPVSRDSILAALREINVM